MRAQGDLQWAEWGSLGAVAVGLEVALPPGVKVSDSCAQEGEGGGSRRKVRVEGDSTHWRVPPFPCAAFPSGEGHQLRGDLLSPLTQLPPGISAPAGPLSLHGTGGDGPAFPKGRPDGREKPGSQARPAPPVPHL